MTHQPRQDSGPPARFTFTDAHPIEKVTSAGTRRTSTFGKAQVDLVSEKGNHRYIAQTSAQVEVEGAGPENSIPATGDSSPRASAVRSAVPKETASTEKQWPQGGLKYKAPLPPEPPDLRALVTRFVFGTATVLVACVACLWLARRWLTNNSPAGRADGRMKLVATVSLSNRSSLQLVDIEGQKVLVGSDASGIKTVTPLTESFLDNLQQAAEEETDDDRERFPFDSLTRQVT